MIILENEQYLRKKFPEIWSNFKTHSFNTENLLSIVTKTGLPSLQIQFNGQQVYLHSKYDPMNEAQQWIVQYEKQIKQYDHVFFYGIGFGYHIEYLMNKYPDKLFTLYEPNPEIFNEYICNRKLNELPLNNLYSLIVQFGGIEEALYEVIQQFNEGYLIIPHPVYERIFEEQSKQFLEFFKLSLYQKAQNIAFTKVNKNLFLLNSINNFFKVVKTPNILREKKGFFKGKPVIMVAAGPSLEDEIENLRRIKEQGSAYIIAVGSSNKALLSHGIYPDAITTYDPYDHNVKVFDKIINENITSIPLIFGSSVGFSTLNHYPGPMLHFIFMRDSISPYYLHHEKFWENNEVINDGASIALITIDLLRRLDCELIVLVGQNFAFKDGQFYSKGISYDYRSNELTQIEKDDSEYVESVNGTPILSMKSFSSEKFSMERLIEIVTPHVEVINTTKNGAKINGAQFMELEQVMLEKLNRSIVTEDWYKADITSYNKLHVQDQINLIDKDFLMLPQLFIEILKVLRKFEKLSIGNNSTKINNTNEKLYNLMTQMVNNTFYLVFIKFDVQNQVEIMNKSIDKIRTSELSGKEVRIIVDAYLLYIAHCRTIYEETQKLFLDFQKYIKQQIG